MEKISHPKKNKQCTKSELKVYDYESDQIVIPIFGHYPLRLLNNDNSCYSNVILQALLHLDQHFIAKINLEAVPRGQIKKNFKCIYNFYYGKMFKKITNIGVVKSLRLREFVARFPDNLSDHFYTNSSMQDAWLFFLELMPKFTIQTRQLFEVTIRNERLCTNCNALILNDEMRRLHGLLSLHENRNETPLSEAYDHLTSGMCHTCNTDALQHYKQRINISNDTKYVVLQCHCLVGRVPMATDHVKLIQN